MLKQLTDILSLCSDCNTNNVDNNSLGGSQNLNTYAGNQNNASNNNVGNTHNLNANAESNNINNDNSAEIDNEVKQPQKISSQKSIIDPKGLDKIITIKNIGKKNKDKDKKIPKNE